MERQPKEKKRRKLNLTGQIFLAMVLAVLVGTLFRDYPAFSVDFLGAFGTVFLNLIKLIVVPVVLFSIICGVVSLQDVKEVGAIGGKTFLYYIVTTIIAISIGLLIATVLGAGKGVNLPLSQAVQTTASSEGSSIAETLINIIPSNILEPMVNTNMLQIIIIALFFGFCALMAGEKGQPFITLSESLNAISMKIMDMIVSLSPIGVFGMLTPVIAQNGPSVLLPLMKFILIVYLGFVLQILITYTTAVGGIAKMKPKDFFKAMTPAMLFAYSSDSSIATLPLTIESCESIGVKKSIASFVLPLGATINMDGTAIYEGITCVFIAQLYGITLTPAQIITIIFMATIASIGTAGVPGGGIVMLTMILEEVGLPLEGLSLILGVDRILDMGRTLVNVTGDASCAVVVNHLESGKVHERELL